MQGLLQMMQRHVAGDAEVPGVRTFTDEEGYQWQVAELDGQAVPAARGERCLVFQAPHAVRRVWCFPQGWNSLSEQELLELSWHR